MHIAIVACGWLGTPLAKALQTSGHKVVATCRSEDKQHMLRQQGIDVRLFSLGEAPDQSALKQICAAELLILNIPPGGRHIQPQWFRQHMTQLIDYAKQQGVRQCIFISTTAVYGEQEGEVTEHSSLQPLTESGRAHVALEQVVRERFAAQACILRLAGLVGEQRHPARHLAGKTALQGAEQAVNLIHQQDVIAAIQAIIDRQAFGQTFHLASHQHPSRMDYYQWACRQMQLPEPQFVPAEAQPSSKQINAQWTCQQLALQLRYPSPYDMLT